MGRTVHASSAHRLAALSLLLAAGVACAQPSISGQIRVDPNASLSRAANETTASASELLPNRIVAGWNDWRLSPTISSEVINGGASLSFDGGATWNDFLIRPPVANQSGVEGDPMTAYDDRTGTLWYGAISFASNGGIYVARLDPTSTTFNASKMARVSSGADKCWMAAGIIPGNPNSTRLYITYNEGCIRSDNMGDTWTAPVSLGSGIGFLPRVASDGTLYVAYWDFGTGMLLKRSTNGGTSFTQKTIATRLDTWGTQDGSRFPGNFRAPPMCYIAVDPNNGTLYAVYFDRTALTGGRHNIDLYFTKSTNMGDTWSTPTHNIHGDAFNQDQFFPWIEVDKTGRIHVTWWDGRATDQNDSTAATNAFFDNYYAYSEDGGNTWHESRLTPSPWNANDDGLNRSQQFVGDYNAMAQAGKRSTPIYIDTRNGDPDVYTNRILFCTADINHDGFLNGDDYDAFANAFESGGTLADYNHDGFVNGDDYDTFAADFEEGC